MSAIKTIIINRGPAAPGGAVDPDTVTVASPAEGDMIQRVGGSWITRTLAQIKTALGLGSAAYTASTDYATAAQGALAASAVQPSALSTGISDHASAADPHGDRAYADSLVVSLLDDRGNHDASSNVFPASGGSGTAGEILKGDLWTISVAGTLGGVAVTAGDVLRAKQDTPGQTAANWVITENNLGYVPENAANKSTSVTTDQASAVKYPTVKSLYDWATGLFATIASLSGYVPTSRTVNGSALSSNVTITTITGNAGTVTGLSVTAGKTLTASNTITLSGTDGSALSIGAGGTLGTAAFTAATAYATSAQGTDERVPSAAGLTSKFSTPDATVVDADRMAIFDSTASFAPKHALLSTLWTWIKSKLSTSGETITVNGPLALTSATRPTSSSTGTPAAESLITLADADARFLKPESARRLMTHAIATASGTGVTSRRSMTAALFDGDISTSGVLNSFYKVQLLLTNNGSLYTTSMASAVHFAKPFGFYFRINGASPVAANTHLMFSIGADVAAGVPASGVNVGIELTSATSVRLWVCNGGAPSYSSAGVIAQAAGSDLFFWLDNVGDGNLKLYYAIASVSAALPAKPTTALCTLAGIPASAAGASDLQAMIRATGTPGAFTALILRDAVYFEY